MSLLRAAIPLACILSIAASPRGEEINAVPTPPAAAPEAAGEGGGMIESDLVAIPVPTIDPDLVAIPAPTIPLRGRIMQKDGVTPVIGAHLEMKGGIEGATVKATSGSGGRFQLKLPPGDYQMRITRRFEIFEAAAVYRVPAGGAVEVDLLLLPDVEPPATEAPRGSKGAADARKKPPAPAPPTIRSGPDPVPEAPRVVGTIVDITRTATSGGHRRWPEALGFLGSLLAILVVSD